jgi:ribonuclease BN (tRNA processing enzyme)
LAFNRFKSDLNKKIIVTSAHSNSKETYKFLTDYYKTPYFPVDFINIIKRFEFLSFEDVVKKFKDLQINTVNLNHPGNSSGYSFINEKKKFCYLLDNEFEEVASHNEQLINFCNNSDTIIWDGMYLDKELIDKKGWGHSSIEQGVKFSNQIQVKNFLISHHAPWREDNEIKQLQKSISNNKVRFASENEVIDF